MKQLIEFIFWEYTGKQICEINDNKSTEFHKRESLLPQYTILKEHQDTKTTPIYAVETDDFFHLYSRLNVNNIFDDEKYILFDFSAVQGDIQEEINCCGDEIIIELIDTNFISMLPKFYINTEDMRRIPRETLVVVNITGDEYWTDCGYEYEAIIELVGYLDSNFNLVTFEGVKGC